jgi:hypothetical protein
MTRRKATFVVDVQTLLVTLKDARNLFALIVKLAELEAGATACAQLEDKSSFARDRNTGLDQLKVEMDKLERYITEYSRMATTRIQGIWRSFLAKRRAEKERHRRATIRIHCACRSFLARRHMAKESSQTQGMIIKHVTQSFNARAKLGRLREQQETANLRMP